MTWRTRYVPFAEKVAFGSITASFADIGTLLRDYNQITMINTTDVDLNIAIGSSSTTVAYIVPDGGAITVRDNIRGAIRVKYPDSAPSVGGIYVNCQYLE